MADFFDRLGEMAEAGLGLWESPSVALGVTYRGKTVFAGAFGDRDAERGLGADSRTLYQIASCTKAFTAALAAMLVDEGSLDWDVPVREYLPEVRFYDEYATRMVCVRDLLCHRTGLPRHEYSWYGTDYTREDIVRNLRFLEPNQPLRTKFQYNNQCYVLAGRVLERLTGKTYEELVQERVFEPLGMGRSRLYVEDLADDPNRAVGYGRPDGSDPVHGQVAIPYYKSSVERRATGVGSPFAPAGCISSCVEDLLKWARLHLGDASAPEGLLSRDALRTLHAPQMILDAPLDMPQAESTFRCYGLGWFVESYRGHTLVEHSGNIDGFSSFVGLLPDLDLGVVALTNMNGSLLHTALAHEVFDHYLGLSDGGWVGRYHDYAVEKGRQGADMVEGLTGARVPGASPSHDLADYAGTYARPGYEPLMVTYEGGALAVEFNRWSVPLSHFHYDTFTLDDVLGELPPGIPVHFGLAPSGGTVDTVSVPLHTEPGTELVRFDRVGSS